MKALSYFASHRRIFLFGGVLLAAIVSLLTDPDSGLATALGGIALVQGVWAVAAAHWARKAVLDYPEADWRPLLRRAGESPTGAGLALLAGAIIFVGLLAVFAPRAHAGEIPSGARLYAPILRAEQVRLWPSHPAPHVLAGLVEQESCVSLRSRSCWNPAARLKSAREEGAGMGQITRAFRDDGSIRFDALADLSAAYGDELAGLSWATIYQRPELQLRAIVLMSRDAAARFRAAPAMIAFGDAAYNGGAVGVQKERRACALKRGCDSGQWFGHVELVCLKSRRPIYAGRSACDINREHVRNVLLVRSEKYRALMEGPAA